MVMPKMTKRGRIIERVIIVCFLWSLGVICVGFMSVGVGWVGLGSGVGMSGLEHSMYFLHLMECLYTL